MAHHQEFTTDQMDDKTIKIVGALRTVFDPEIPVNIYDIGLIYNIRHNDKHVEIDMTLTSPNCPSAEVIPLDVETAVCNLDDFDTCRVTVVWEPTWTPEQMSEAARLDLGFI